MIFVSDPVCVASAHSLDQTVKIVFNIRSEIKSEGWMRYAVCSISCRVKQRPWKFGDGQQAFTNEGLKTVSYPWATPGYREAISIAQKDGVF